MMPMPTPTVTAQTASGLRKQSTSVSAKIEQELGLKPKKTIRDAVLDIKIASEKGLLDWNDANFYNVKKMKTLVDNKQVVMI